MTFPSQPFISLFAEDCVTLGDIRADRRAARLEAGHFLFRQIVFYHLFYAIRTDNRRYAAENTGLAVFAVQRSRTGKNTLFIMKNRADQSRSRRSNAVLRTLLAGISHPSAFNGALLYFLFIKPELWITFHFRQRLAVKAICDQGTIWEFPCSPSMNAVKPRESRPVCSDIA